MKKTHYHVVAAVIRHDDQYLCMQRGQTRFPYTSFKYEFPGGKVELGETAEEALRREIREEMDYAIIVGPRLMTVIHEYPDFCITMEAFLSEAATREFCMREHHACQWLPAERLMDLDWAAADVLVAKKISNLLL